nr:hypothetical protein [Candidatus Njordarchaeum guaymaensis]
MSPLRKGKKKEKKEEEAETVEEKVEVAPKEVEPITWFSELTNLGEVRSDLALLPDVDIQFQISNSLVRFVKKGLEKPTLSEERSLRPDAMIMISEKAWKEVAKTQGLDEFVNLYRKYSKNPTPEKFIRVNINQQKLLTDRGILRSKLFKALLLS